jgi:putative transposase
LLLKNSGAARWAYNWGLSQKKAAMDAKQKIPNNIELHRRLNGIKKADCPWMYETSKCSAQEALRNLDRAFANFWAARKKNRKVGFPKYKSRKKGVGGFRLTGSINVQNDRIQLPRLGTIRLKERDYLPLDAKVLSATISEKAGKWFVSVLVEQDQPEFTGKKDDKAVVGVDLGIKTLATVSDGTVYKNPKPLRTRLRKLKRLQQSISRKVKGSRNQKKAADRVARLHYRIGNIRRDGLHKMTSHLTRTKSVIGIEDLNVSGMLRNRSLSRAVSELGLFELRRQLEYKAKWYNCRVVLVDRFFPSSKTCSACGEINENLVLSDREWTCSGCKTTHDRDMNAAVNLEWVAASSAETINACGEESSGSGVILNETVLGEARMKQVLARARFP